MEKRVMFNLISMFLFAYVVGEFGLSVLIDISDVHGENNRFLMQEFIPFEIIEFDTT